MSGMGFPESKDRGAVDMRKGFRKNRKGRLRQKPPWMVKMRTECCHYCGGPGGTIDHVIPKSKGGVTSVENCVPACQGCNNLRGNQSYESFKNGGWMMQFRKR